MTGVVKAAIATAVAFCILDFAWLGFLAPAFYQDQLGTLLRPEPALFPAAMFYLLYVTALIYFCVRPSLAEGGLRSAAFKGAFFGLAAYGTYDLSNLATLQDWTVAVTLVDMAWGAVLSAAASSVGYIAGRNRYP